MLRPQPPHALQLHHQFLFHHDIREITPHILALINHLHRRLRLNSHTSQPQLLNQSPLINLLQKTGTQSIRNLKDSPNHTLAESLIQNDHEKAVRPSAITLENPFLSVFIRGQ